MFNINYAQKRGL